MGGLPNQMGGLDFLAPPCPPVSPPIGETLHMWTKVSTSSPIMLLSLK